MVEESKQQQMMMGIDNGFEKPITFYEKKSGFQSMGSSKTVKGAGDYALTLTQSKLFPREMVLANTDYSIQLFDLDTMKVSLNFNEASRHKAKISSLKYSRV